MSGGDQAGWYSGSDSYKFVDPLIKGNSLHLKIVSPYITVDYAKTLLNAAKRKEIKIITSDSATTNNAVNLILKRTKVWPYVSFACYIIILEVAFALFHFYLLDIVFIPVLIVSFLLAIHHYKSMKGRKIYVRIAKKPFIHEKLYITDYMAITGSANLTYMGMHKNIEHIEMVDDRRKIDELTDHFDNLWKRAELV
jgi:phosphatidylserine/phosphatidylglycerophosphate/cardiolipin synthase-like enzyme